LRQRTPLDANTVRSARAMTSIVPPDPPTKTCTLCGVVYPATTEYFHRDKGKRCGLQPQCTLCRNNVKTAWRTKYPERHRVTSRAYQMGLRMGCLLAYGGEPPVCACCGEYRIPFLAIDHINGGGKTHRLSIGAATIGPHAVYRWLKKNGYPEGFRVLCHNCNYALGLYGKCPHEDEHARLVDTTD
jgi:hypothetical protein